VCSIATRSGRVTLSEQTLITTVGDRRTSAILDDDAAILEEYRTTFGIDLDHVPRLRRPTENGVSSSHL
jgi:hypothetical protein